MEGGKDPGAFVIATCELAGHILIYDREKYDTIVWSEIVKAHEETCQNIFNIVKPKVMHALSEFKTLENNIITPH